MQHTHHIPNRDVNVNVNIKLVLDPTVHAGMRTATECVKKIMWSSVAVSVAKRVLL